jgi:hypothetical protein
MRSVIIILSTVLLNVVLLTEAQPNVIISALCHSSKRHSQECHGAIKKRKKSCNPSVQRFLPFVQTQRKDKGKEKQKEWKKDKEINRAEKNKLNKGTQKETGRNRKRK